MTDADLAACLADLAGTMLLRLRESGVSSGKALGRIGDLAANALIVETLRAERPEDGLLSEESADDPVRLDKRRVWIIDPLDGTREYGEGRDDWAVHVALAIDGRAVIGAVAQPSLGKTYRSDDVRAPVEPALRIVASRTRPPVEADRAARALGAELIGMGSAGAKAMAVLRGEAIAYIHAGGQHEWDSAAPVAVAAGAGFHVSRLDGAPLGYNRPVSYLPDLVIAHPVWAERIMAAIGSG